MEKHGFTIKALDLSTWDAFAALVEANNGIFGGCWCMGFHPEETTHLDAPQPHREQKLDRVRAGTAHAALVFDGDDCVGWCQFGPPDEVPRIKNRKEYEKQLDELPRLAGRLLLRRQGPSPPGSCGRSARRGARTDRRAGRWHGRGLPGTRRRRAGRLPLSRCAVDLRACRLPPGPKDRKTPLGCHRPSGNGLTPRDRLEVPPASRHGCPGGVQT